MESVRQIHSENEKMVMKKNIKACLTLAKNIIIAKTFREIFCGYTRQK